MDHKMAVENHLYRYGIVLKEIPDHLVSRLLNTPTVALTKIDEWVRREGPTWDALDEHYIEQDCPLSRAHLLKVKARGCFPDDWLIDDFIDW